MIFNEYFQATYFTIVYKTTTTKNGKSGKKGNATGKLYNKWINRTKSQETDDTDVDGNNEDEDQEVVENPEDGQSQIIFTDSQINNFESERKNLAHKTSFPVSTNIEAWRSLRNYRFHMIKTDKNINIWEKWPLYTHSDGACLVNTMFIRFISEN